VMGWGEHDFMAQLLLALGTGKGWYCCCCCCYCCKHCSGIAEHIMPGYTCGVGNALAWDAQPSQLFESAGDGLGGA
jgi:hypothetical protein